MKSVSISLKNIAFIILVIFQVSIFLSCNKSQKEEEIIDNLFGKEMVLPKNIVVLENFDLDTIPVSQFNSDIQIVSTIDGRCPACINRLSELMNVKKRIDQKTDQQIDFLFFVYTQEFEVFEKEYYSLLDCTIPIIIQKDLSFLEKNPLPGFGVYQTVLTINDKIRLVGNPAINTELEKIVYQRN